MKVNICLKGSGFGENFNRGLFVLIQTDQFFDP